MSNYDVIVMGSGLGGLVTATILQKNGYRVCVLEKNRQFGGALQIFVREKTIHDTGVHYIGGLAPGQNLHQFFSYCGIMDQLNIRRLNLEAFDQISFSGANEVYNIPQGYERFAQQMKSYFPKEAKAIDEYCAKLQEISHSTDVYNLQPFEPGNLSPYLSTGLYDFLHELTSNEKLIKVLMGNNLLYIGDQEKTSLYEHALIMNSYIQSAWKCIDGGAQIANALVQQIKKLGGTVKNYAEVNHIDIDDTKTISSVQLKNGNTFKAKHYISNIHPAETLKLIGKEHFRKTYYERITQAENTTAVFSLFLNLKDKIFPYLNYNIYHFIQKDFWQGGKYKPSEWPKSFAAFTPANSKDPKYADSLNVMAYMDFSEVEQWSESFRTIPQNRSERSSSYSDFKAKKAEQLIKAIEARFPNIRDCIASIHTATPLSYRDYLASPMGSMYGMQKDFQNPMATYLSPNTKIRNLYFTGQNLNLHGILGVTISAFVTSSIFVDINKLMKEVRKA